MRLLFAVLQLSILIFSTNILFAQDYPRKKYNLEEGRKISYRLTDDEAKAHAITILDSRFIDYTEDASYTNIELYITRHVIIRVNDDKGIDEFNKVYIPVETQDELVKLRARTITKDGVTRYMDEDNTKLLNVSKEFINYKILALEGVEAGSEVEYFYTLRRVKGMRSLWGNHLMFGTEIYQGSTKVKEANFTITTPPYLLIDVRSYNGFPNVMIDKNVKPVVLYSGIKDIPAISNEQYSTAKANCMKIVYKINRNTRASFDNSIFTWNTVMGVYYRNLFSDYYPVGIPNDLKISALDHDGKIRAIENYIKKNVTYKMSLEESLLNPRQILKTKLGSYWGVLRLYAALFKAADIPFNLVVTSNRYESTFDPGFTDFNSIHEILFYFPLSQQYLWPNHTEHRYGPPPYQLANNYAIFIESEEKGRLQMISFLDVNHNKSRMQATVTIDSTMEFADVKKIQVWAGYEAMDIKGLYNKLNAEQRSNYLEYLPFDSMINGKIIDQQVENIDVNDTDENGTLKLSTHFVSSTLIEHAGNNYLLNIGWLIGKQSELYQKEKRENDIEMAYPNQLIRTIYVKIPKGYKVKGLEDINIDKAFIEKDQRACQFVSSYMLNGNDVAINIHEYYTTASYPKERYEEFRQVINAAADFNKVQLVLEKE